MQKRANSELLALICAIADQASANATILENSKPGTFPDSEEEYEMQLEDLRIAFEQLYVGTVFDEDMLDWMDRKDSPFDDYFE